MLRTPLIAKCSVKCRPSEHESQEYRDHDTLPSAEDFVAHATSALAPVAWHIIKGLSQLEAQQSSDEDNQPAAG